MADAALLADDELKEIIESLSFHEWTRLCGEKLAGHIAAQAAEIERLKQVSSDRIVEEVFGTGKRGRR